MSNWYERSRLSVQSTYPKNWRLMIGFLAVTSVNTTVKANVTLALKALKQYEDGDPFQGFMGAVIANLERVIRGEPLSGRKIKAFHEALLGNRYAVVIDRWMYRAYGFDKQGINEYRAVEAAILREAEEAEMYPADYQARLWCEVRGAGEDFSDVLRAKHKEVKNG